MQNINSFQAIHRLLTFLVVIVFLSAFSIKTNAACPCPGGATVSGGNVSLWSAVIVPGATICLTGNLIINVNYTFNNNIFYIQDNVTITVNTNINLTITNGSHLQIADPTCNVLWQGINCWASGSSVTVNGGSIIEHATTAINCSAGTYTINGATFNKNATAIYVNTSYAAFTGTITNSNITCLNGAATAPIGVAPYPNRRSLIGIDISNTLAITIGNSNTFDNLDCGISIRASNATIASNLFYRIDEPSPYSINPKAYGIYAWNTTPAFNVTVNNCYIGALTKPVYDGIYIDGNYNFAIQNNIMNNLQSNGIYMTNNHGTTNMILGNKINNFIDNAIFCENNPGISSGQQTSIFIQDNPDISNTTWTATAINVQEATAANPFVLLRVLNNPYIKGIRYGIYAKRLWYPVVNNNTVYIQESGGNTPMGIAFINGRYGAIEYSHVTGSTNIGTSTEQCIHLENHRSFAAFQNSLSNSKYGFYGTGDLTNGTFYCNSLDQNWSGFGLALIPSGSLGPVQGPIPFSPSDNCWFPNNQPGYDIRCINTPGASFAWYVIVPNAVTCLQPTSTWVISGSAVSPIQINGSSPCNPPLYKLDSVSTSEQEREHSLGAIVRGEKTYPDDNSEYRDQVFAYETLADHPEFLNLGTDDDQLYQLYFNSFSGTNIEAIYKFNLACLSGDTATTIMTNLVPKNEYEANLQTTSLIYLRTLLKGNHDFSAEDSSTLNTLAFADPLKEGDAVYIAQVMLDTMVSQRVDDGSEDQRLAQESIDAIYPNPANNEIYVRAIQHGSTQLRIFDLTGRMISEIKIEDHTSDIPISVSFINPGVYLYQISSNDHLQLQDKLVIVR